MIHIYTGDGKGKTTAALGLALRAVGAGRKVLIVQFMKTSDTSEVGAIKKFLSGIEVKCFGRKGFVKLISNYSPYGRSPIGRQFPISNDFKIQKNLAHQAFEYVKKAANSKKYNLLILDEINMALYFGLLKLDKVVDFIKSVSQDLELVLTGRNANPKIIKLADLVTEMKEKKHYYNKGIKARRGIEY